MCGATSLHVWCYIIHFALDISFSTLEYDYSRIVHALVILMNYVMSWSYIIELYMYVSIHFLPQIWKRRRRRKERRERGWLLL